MEIERHVPGLIDHLRNPAKSRESSTVLARQFVLSKPFQEELKFRAKQLKWSGIKNPGEQPILDQLTGLMADAIHSFDTSRPRNASSYLNNQANAHIRRSIKERLPAPARPVTRPKQSAAKIRSPKPEKASTSEDRSPEDEKLVDLVVRAKSDPDALAEIYHKHVGFLHFMAKKYNLRRPRYYSYWDLYQDACEGLVHAVRRFNPERGSFLSFARVVIRNKLSSAVSYGQFEKKGSLLRVISQMFRIKTELAKRLKRSPSSTEIAEAMSRERGQRVSAERVDDLQRAYRLLRVPDSMDAVLSPDSENTMYDRVAGPAKTPEARVMKQSDPEWLEDIFAEAGLSDLERFVFRHWHRFGGGPNSNVRINIKWNKENPQNRIKVKSVDNALQRALDKLRSHIEPDRTHALESVSHLEDPDVFAQAVEVPTLTEVQRKLLWMRYRERQTNVDIARQTGYALQTVRRYFELAHQKIREHQEARG